MAKKYHFLINLRIRKDEIEKMLLMNSFKSNIVDVDFKKSFTKFKNSLPVSFKLSSYKKTLDTSLVRMMSEGCLGVNVDDFSMTPISHKTFLKQRIEVNNSSKHNEIDDFNNQLIDYKNELTDIELKVFSNMEFEKACGIVMTVLDSCKNSKKVHLKHSDFRYFTLEKHSKDLCLYEIAIDNVR